VALAALAEAVGKVAGEVEVWVAPAVGMHPQKSVLGLVVAWGLEAAVAAGVLDLAASLVAFLAGVPHKTSAVHPERDPHTQVEPSEEHPDH
jgi:hypothetical protein